MLDATRPTPADPWLTAWAAEIPRALAGLSSALQGGRLTEPVLHKSRRELKRLRSLLRLAPRSTARLSQEARDITGELRRRLGHSRDATVMLKTLRSFADDLGPAATRIEPVLSAHHRAVSGELDRRSRRADHDRIVRLSAVWRGRPICGSRAELREGALNTYRRARKRARALAAGDLGALHPLRKATVDHQNHLGFFAIDKKNSKISKLYRKVRRLRDSLGLCQDFEVLRDFVRTRSDVSASDLIKLEEVLGKRHQQLVKKSTKLAANLFDDKPRDFARRLKRALRDPEDLPDVPVRTLAATMNGN
jgi:CHAD domain-containing protein